MISAIIRDFLSGLMDSQRWDLIAKQIYFQPKLQRLSMRIVKTYGTFYLAKIVIQYFHTIACSNMIWTSFLFFITGIALWIMPIFLTGLNLLHYVDLINQISCVKKTPRPKSKSNVAFGCFSAAIIMGFYQMVIFSLVNVVDYGLHERFHVLGLAIKFGVLTIYHSMYCFNNLWQYRDIDLACRVEMHEKFWPYYMGFGSCASLLYMMSYELIYDIYFLMLVALPFLTRTKYPHRITLYPAINLKIFADCTAAIVHQGIIMIPGVSPILHNPNH